MFNLKNLKTVTEKYHGEALSRTDSWREVFKLDDEEKYFAALVSVGQRGGGDPEIGWCIKSSTSYVDLTGPLRPEVIWGYGLNRGRFKTFVENMGNAVYPFENWAVKAQSKFETRYRESLKYMIRAKECQIGLIDEVMQFINQEKHVELTKLLKKNINKLISAISGFMVKGREWKDGKNFHLKAYYRVITYRGCKENIVLPKSIKIYINEDAAVRYSSKIYKPALTENTGNRMACQAIAIFSKLFGFMDNISFTGMYEWLRKADNITPMETEDSGDNEEIINKIFGRLEKGIREGKRKLLIQDDTDKRFIAQCLTLEIIREVILQILHSSQWKKGLQDVGRPWNSDLVVATINYDYLGEPDAKVTWADQAERINTFLGYPLPDDRTAKAHWTAMLDLRGIGDLEVIKDCTCRYTELNGTEKWKGTNGKGVDFMDIDTHPMKYWRKEKGYYEIENCKVERDGTINFLGDSTVECLVMVESVDEWIKVWYNEYAWLKPALKISVMNYRRGWQENLQKMGIDKKYVSMGYSFLFSGKMLDVDKETLSIYTLSKELGKDLKKVLNSILKGTKVGDAVDKLNETSKIVTGTIDNRIKQTGKDVRNKFNRFKNKVR
jgi:hypothetical protein